MDYRAIYARLFEEMSRSAHQEAAVRAAEHHAYGQARERYERCASLARHYEGQSVRRVPVEVRVPVQQTYVIWEMRPTTIYVREPYRIRAGWRTITLWRTVAHTVYWPVPVPHTRVVWVTTTQWVTVRDVFATALAFFYQRCADDARGDLADLGRRITARRTAWDAHWADLNQRAHDAWRAFNTTCRTIREVGNNDVQECAYGEWRNYSPGTFERTIFVPPAPPPEQLIRRARDQVTPPGPVVRLNPRVEWEQIVHLPTWMWIEPGAWRPETARADAGRAWAEATATPAKVVWDMGNGDRVTCSGPGTPYDEGRHEAGQRTGCSYTYGQSSAGRPDDAYPVTATLVYDVTWQGSGGAGGNLGTISRSATIPVRVAELQALVDQAG